MSDFYMKEVRFDIWCPSCLYYDVDDTRGKEPCNECLTECARKNTTRPRKHKRNTLGSGVKG